MGPAENVDRVELYQSNMIDHFAIVTGVNTPGGTTAAEALCV